VPIDEQTQNKQCVQVSQQ